MGQYAALASGIAAVVGEIADVGLVYDYAVLTDADWSKFVQRFTTTIGGERVVRAWTVGYLGSSGTYRVRAGAAVKLIRDVRFLVRGVFGMNATSEAAFRDKVEQVVNALDADPSLGGAALDHAPCEVEATNAGMGVVLGNVASHMVEITVTAQVEVTAGGNP